jgi:long-chain acyl-CoA synthetase
VLAKLPQVHAALLIGDGRCYVCAILFVSAESASQPAVMQQALHAEVQRKLADYSEFERPKRLLLIPSAPADYPEFMTPTLKLKRSAVLTHFADAIEQLYATDGGSVLSLPPLAYE